MPEILLIDSMVYLRPDSSSALQTADCVSGFASRVAAISYAEASKAVEASPYGGMFVLACAWCASSW